MSTPDGTPGTSAQAMIAVPRDIPQRALKSTLDELDDEDAAIIGRTFTDAKHHLPSLVGMAVGLCGGLALLPFSLAGSAAVLAGLPIVTAAVLHRGTRSHLVEQGFAVSLVDELARAATFLVQLRASRHLPELAARTREHDIRAGRVIIDAALARRARAQAQHTSPSA